MQHINSAECALTGNKCVVIAVKGDLALLIWVFMELSRNLIIRYCQYGLDADRLKRYKQAMIRKWHNQKDISTPQTEGWEKTQMTFSYLYQENTS